MQKSRNLVVVSVLSFGLTASGCNFFKSKESVSSSSDSNTTASEPTKTSPVAAPSPVAPSVEPSPEVSPSPSPLPSPKILASPSPAPSATPSTSKPQTLDTWLDAHPTVKNAIRIETSASTFLANNNLIEKSWATWSETEKQSLRDAFDREWAWLYQTENPFQNLGADEFTMPLPCARCLNNFANSPNVSPMTLIDNSDGLKVYYAFVAHALAVEIGGAVNWSILDRPESELHHYFNSRAMMHRYGSNFLFGESPWEPNLRIKNIGNATPATPRFIFSWLKQNGILKNNRTDTIIALLHWSRENLVHFYGADSYLSAVEHWNTPTRPPVASVLQGTVRKGEDPQSNAQHWTGGCHGTSGLFKEVLRAVNIPVEVLRLCGHAQIHFLTEEKYLSHGDDPYNQVVIHSHRETAALLIDQATHEKWFTNQPDNLKSEDPLCNNIGRGAAEF